MARETVGKARRATHAAAAVFVSAERPRPEAAPLETSAFKRKLADPRARVVTVEVEPPKGFDASAALDGARTLKAIGVDAVNVTDNPMARLRMSSIAVAHLIRHETGAETVFHFSPRDRNVLGIQSDLLGAAGLGIKALLVVGGDPLKIGDYPQAKPVGEVDTLGLLRIVKGLNAGVDLAGGAIGAATSFAIALRREPRREGPRRRDLEALREDRGGRDVRPDAARLRPRGARPLLCARRVPRDPRPRRPHPAEEPEAGPLLRERGPGHGRARGAPRADAQGRRQGARVRGGGRHRALRSSSRRRSPRACAASTSCRWARYGVVKRILEALVAE